MLAETSLPNHWLLTLAARFLFTSLFLLSGVTHFTNIPYYVSLMPEAVPFKVQLTLVSGVVELLSAAMILFNWRPRLGGWLRSQAARSTCFALIVSPVLVCAMP